MFRDSEYQYATFLLAHAVRCSIARNFAACFCCSYPVRSQLQVKNYTVMQFELSAAVGAMDGVLVAYDAGARFSYNVRSIGTSH